MSDKKSKPVPWRMSPEARKVLSDVSTETGMSMTEVLEVCVAKYALGIPALSHSVKEEMVKLIARQLVQDKKKKKSSLPLSLKQRTKDRKKLRAVLGWKKWKQDVTRHTAASMWLACCGSAATVATALGHSESVLRKNYMALVTKAEAEKFWNLAGSQTAHSKPSGTPSGKASRTPRRATA